MAFTKKHFAAVAGLVRSSIRDTHKGIPGPEQDAAIALAVAVVKQFFPNPDFDEARFIAVCTPEPPTIDNMLDGGRVVAEREGYVVTWWSGAEVGEADPETLLDVSIGAGNSYLDSLKRASDE